MRNIQAYQGDIAIVPLEDLGKSAADVRRDSRLRPHDYRLLIQEGEITGHHHGVWFMPKPVYLRDDAMAYSLAEASPVIVNAQLFEDGDLAAKLISDRPTKLTVDAQNRPHGENGPFCEWRDRSRLYSWHGIRVPAWCIEEKHKITKEAILAESNTEIRRSMCEILGWPKALDMLGGKVIHADECLGLPRKLIETDIGGERVRLLHMVNGTIEHGERREFVEGVPVEIATCHDAVAWQYGLPSKIYNEGIRT